MTSIDERRQLTFKPWIKRFAGPAGRSEATG